MDQERLSLMALQLVPGIGSFMVRQLVNHCGSAEEVFKKSKAKLLKIPEVGEVTAETIRQSGVFHKAEKELRRAEKEHSRVIFFTENAYPARLLGIGDAPTLLYVKGNINLNLPKSVAIVGTRKATTYGKEQVERIVEELVPHRPLIISGLAYGIDIHAHKQALELGLPTIGILGSGLDIIYPAVHREIARKMINNGGLVTENPFGTQPDAHNFPSRNRIIAGMCDALIVVEAALKGGALITAEIANSYNKDVFAVPGNLGLEFSEGCNRLIKINKASLYTSVKDIEYLLNWSPLDSERPSQLSLGLSPYSPQEQAVLETLRKSKVAMGVDDLGLRTGFDPGTLASLLLALEFKNAIAALPGKSYRMKF